MMPTDFYSRSRLEIGNWKLEIGAEQEKPKKTKNRKKPKKPKKHILLIFILININNKLIVS